MKTVESATESRWIDAIVVSSTPAGAATRLLRVGAARPLRWRSGQVVELGARGADSGYFAICSAPVEGPDPRVLVKASGGASGALAALAPGGAVRITRPFGPGYPLELAVGRDLLLVAAGTGIAPLRSALAAVLADRGRYGALTLVHGVRTPGGLSFAAEHAAWRAAGVDIHPVISRPSAAAPWAGRTGWVQAHLREVATPGALVLVAGMPEMERGVRATLAELGYDEADVWSNWP